MVSIKSEQADFRLTDNRPDQGDSSTLSEFLSTDNPADPKFDRLQQAIRARLCQSADGRELIARLEEKLLRIRSAE